MTIVFDRAALQRELSFEYRYWLSKADFRLGVFNKIRLTDQKPQFPDHDLNFEHPNSQEEQHLAQHTFNEIL